MVLLSFAPYVDLLKSERIDLEGRNFLPVADAPATTDSGGGNRICVPVLWKREERKFFLPRGEATFHFVLAVAEEMKSVYGTADGQGRLRFDCADTEFRV